jgi:hypothetical protein
MATVAVLADPGWKDGGRGGSILKLPPATLTLPLEPLRGVPGLSFVELSASEPSSGRRWSSGC